MIELWLQLFAKRGSGSGGPGNKESEESKESEERDEAGQDERREEEEEKEGSDLADELYESKKEKYMRELRNDLKNTRINVREILNAGESYIHKIGDLDESYWLIDKYGNEYFYTPRSGDSWSDLTKGQGLRMKDVVYMQVQDAYGARDSLGFNDFTDRHNRVYGSEAAYDGYVRAINRLFNTDWWKRYGSKQKK